MADQWDAFPDAGGTAVAEDQFAHFPDAGTSAAKSSSLRTIIGKVLGKVQDVGKEAFTGLLPPEIMDTVFGGTSGGMREGEQAKPIVSPDAAKEFLGTLPTWAGGSLPVVQGATDSLGNAISGLTNPATLAQLPTFAVPGVAETFALNTASELPKQGRTLADVFHEHGILSKESGQALGDAGITDLMGLLAGFGGTAARSVRTAGEIARAPEPIPPEAPIPTPTESLNATPEGVTVPTNKQVQIQAKGQEQAQTQDGVLAQPAQSVQSAAAPESILPATALPEAGPASAQMVGGEPVQATTGTRLVGPALVDTDGNVIAQGKLGDTHADLLKTALAGPDAEKAVAAFENDAQHAFVDDQGNILNREQAAPIGISAGQIPEGTTKVESQMLKAEAAAATTAEVAAEVAQSPTGIRNAIVDEQRKARGLPERMEPLRQTNPESWDAAMARMDENPNAGRELIADIVNKPRALKPVESALLAHETVTRENSFDNAVEAVNKATDEGDLAEAKQRLAKARDDVQELYDVGQKAGTESGQSLQARKILVSQDYSLSKMEAVTRAVANDGKPLSEEQAAEVKSAHDKITDAQSKLQAHEDELASSEMKKYFDQLIKETRTAAKVSIKEGAKLQDFLDQQAEKARDRIVARRGQLRVTVDPLNVAGLVDEAIIGASHIARGITNFADWSAQMIKDFGDRISPYLKDLFERAKQYHDANAKEFEKPSSQEVALKRYKTNIRNRTEDVEARVEAGDFTKPVRNATQLDEEATKLRADYQRAKDAFDRGVETARLKNRSPLEKTLDTFAKWRRAFVLSSPVTLAKLTSAAVERMTFTPLEEAVGAGISKLIPSVAERAPREGGASIKAEARALTEGFTKGMKDSWDVLRTGQSDLDVLYGKKNIMPREAIDFLGSLHGALKTVTKRNEFARSLQKRVESAMNDGIDTTDPLVQTRLAVEAYKDANRSIFMQDNRVVSFYKRGLSALEQVDKATGKVPLGSKIAATTMRILLPIVKVPTNIAAETLQYSIGTITGSARLANAFRNGIENLPPEQADLILRDLKKGSVGAAVMLLGYLNAQNVGGYYQPGEKRPATDVKAGHVKLFGVDVPTYLIHNPLLETLQIGATIRRVADSKLRKKDTETQGVGAGTMAAALGLAEEVPFFREMFGELPKLFDQHQRAKFIGEFAKSLVVPQASQWLATHFDQANGETIKRNPQTFLQHIETGIPGLREKVPVKPEGKKRKF